MIFLEVDIFDDKSIKNAIKKLQELKRDVRLSIVPAILQRLGAIGLRIAQVNFATAQYDGFNDAQVTLELIGVKKAVIKASGESVLFIEFGTGVGNAPIHPEASELGFERGQYGKQKGLNPPWVYIGQAGTSGRVIGWNPRKGQIVKTRGNPANMCMYKMRKDLEQQVVKIVKEEFDNYFGGNGW